jgi:protein-S-isoprenylcysteine O-methyltransferase Ste14
MDTRSMKDKLRFYLMFKDSFSLRIIGIYLAIFILMKFINPNWSLSMQVSSSSLDGLLSFGGLFIYLLGMTFCVWARITMKDTWTPAEQTSIIHRKKLLTTGPFSFTRNPIYLGLILINLGFFVALKSYLIVVVLFVGLYLNKKATNEEKILERDFGSEYLRYKSKVRRFV